MNSIKPMERKKSLWTLGLIYFFCSSSLLTGCNPQSSTSTDTTTSTATSTSTPTSVPTATSTTDSTTNPDDTSSGPTASPLTPEAVSAIPKHPLDPLTASEIEETMRVLKNTGKVTDASRFASIGLSEPAKESVLNFKQGDKLQRKSFSVIYEVATNKTFEAEVDLHANSLEHISKLMDRR